MFESNKIIRLVVIVAAAALVSTAVAALADDIHAQIQTQGSVRYLCGGIGFGEREALSAMASQEKMNLKLVFAERSREFLSAVPVKLTNASGAVVLNVTTDGPWLFAKLPAGEYHYRAERAGHVQSGSVTVPETGRAEVVVAFP